MSRKIIWLGAGIGGTIGGLIPLLWGDDMLSPWAIFLSMVGGLLGIWLAVKVSTY